MQTMLDVLGQKSELSDLYDRVSDVASLALDEAEDAEEESVQQKVL